MTDERFPDRVYALLTVEGDVETLDFAPDLEDLDGDASGPVAVYELRSVGRVARTFVASDNTLEQKHVPSSPEIGRVVP